MGSRSSVPCGSDREVSDIPKCAPPNTATTLPPIAGCGTIFCAPSTPVVTSPAGEQSADSRARVRAALVVIMRPRTGLADNLFQWAAER